MVYKCKMCGGTLEIEEGKSVAVCDYCGTKQTLPTDTDENNAHLFSRANNLRLHNEFDKAQAIYERIIENGSTDSEAYWGLVLCKYGIEYVKDPKSKKRIPTCHRAQVTSVLSDADYKSAVKNADSLRKKLYEQEAKEIDRLQKEILELSSKEEPYDVFICYKESDERGKRTQDSAIANDIYYQLTQEGFKVFYSAITLEDKLGSAYEPAIYAALNSAKVMLAIGTKPEYFNAVWVKNEWSRYLKIIDKDYKKALIPCYKDMDAYDLPEEFAHLQAQDMGKIGFIPDIVRGIKKIINASKESEAPKVVTTINTNATGNVNALLERAFLFLEDGKWAEADTYCEKVLDQDPKNGRAYLGKLLAKLKVRKVDDLNKLNAPFDHMDDYQKVMRFGSQELQNSLDKINTNIRTRSIEAKNNELYQKAQLCARVGSISKLKEAVEIFNQLGDWKDSAKLAQEYQKEYEAKYEAKKVSHDKKNKIICIVATIVVLLSIILPTSIVIPIKKERDGVKYKVCDGYCSVVGWESVYSDGGKVVIKSEYKGLPVTNISGNAFSCCSSLRSITIPSGVESIGDYAFAGDWDNPMGLTSITFEEGSALKSIGEMAFYNCSSLTSITIPSGVESIGESAFSCCRSLTSITFEEGSVLKSIGEMAFYNCRSLTSITIPSGVESIGYEAFYYCSSLTSITFEDTSNWYKIYYDSTNAYDNWQNKRNGTAVSASELSNASSNASNFSSDYDYYDYYWYKKR